MENNKAFDVRKVVLQKLNKQKKAHNKNRNLLPRINFDEHQVFQKRIIYHYKNQII